jgi:acetyl esterase/lipase
MLTMLGPQVTAFLQQLSESAAQQQAPSRSLSRDEMIAETRQMALSMCAALGLSREPVSSISNIQIPGPAGEIPVRIYAPSSNAPAAMSLPALISITEEALSQGI